MALTKDMTKMDLKGYTVLLAAATLGWTQDVDPSGLKVDMVEKKIGELGNITVDKVIVGMSGSIKVVLHQVSIDVFRAVIPGAPATGPIPLIPTTQFASMYATAQLLTIHPRGNPDASEDINLVKAIISNYKLPPSSDGKTWRKIEIEFEPLPDQDQLIATPSKQVYGYIGTPPG